MGRGVPLDQLILVTRTPDKLSSFAANGAEVRQGDFEKPETLDKAFAGGRDLLLISTSGGDRLAQHTAAISAARRAGIRRIVYTSFINPTLDNPATVARDHRLTEEALARSGMAYTVLRNQLYMDGLLDEAAKAISRPATCTRTPLVASGRPSAGVTARKWQPWSCRPAATKARCTSITGSELINRQDFAKLITEVTGKRVLVINVDDKTFVQRAVSAGQPEAARRRPLPVSARRCV